MNINATHSPPLPPTYDTPDILNDDQTTASAKSRQKRGVADTAYLWPQGATIKIGMVGTTRKEEELIRENIKKWAPYVNLNFEFIADPKDADVRIEVDSYSDEGYAWIGTENKLHPDAKAHVTIGTNASPEHIADTVMHEWGHVLGLKHEHEHPYRNLDDPDLEDTPPLPDDGSLTLSPYDNDSIMHYTFETDSDGESVFRPKTISEEDKKFVSTLYPPFTKKPPNLASNHPLQNPAT